MISYRLLADVVVAAHAAYVGFVVFGLLLILIGAARGWRWVRNFWFRLVHLAMIVVVVGESLGGITCPLTTLEDHLRELAGETVHSGSFIGRWAHELLFYDAPPPVFTVIYCVFGAIVVAAFIFAPPHWPRWPVRVGGGDL
jgi:hypothetical protein